MIWRWRRIEAPVTEKVLSNEDEIETFNAPITEEHSEGTVVPAEEPQVEAVPDGLNEPIPVPALTDDEKQKLEFVWRELGYQNGKLSLQQKLHSTGTPVYDIRKVFDHLQSKARWWFLWPLRSQDIIKPDGIAHLWADVEKWPSFCDTRRLYQKKKSGAASPFRGDVPLSVLMKVKELRNQFGSRLRCLVAADTTDRFLLLSVDDCALVVIERWSA